MCFVFIIITHTVLKTSTFVSVCFSNSVLPSSLGDYHFRANLVEPFPQVWSLQVHSGLLPGAGDRRRARSCGLRALQQRVLALRWTGKRRDWHVWIAAQPSPKNKQSSLNNVLNFWTLYPELTVTFDFRSTQTWFTELTLCCRNLVWNTIKTNVWLGLGCCSRPPPHRDCLQQCTDDKLSLVVPRR